VEHLHHFGLKLDPFQNEPDLRFYFDSISHSEPYRRIERGLRQSKGLCVLTGEGGTGKTLLTRRLLEGLEEEIFDAQLMLMMPGATDATSVLNRYARMVGIEEAASDRPTQLAQIYEQLAIVREEGRHSVLMLDDAQLLSMQALAEIGGLLNLEYEDRRLISMLLIGSPELDQIIQNDPAIAPRVEVRVRLQPLENANTTAYIAHRLAHVGGPVELIPQDAMDALHKLGRGRPRLLNTLADNALFEAYLAGRKTIDASDIERAAADLGVGSELGETFSGPTNPSTILDAVPNLVPEPVAPPTTEPLVAATDFDLMGETTEEDVLELSNAILEPTSALDIECLEDEIAPAEFEGTNPVFASDPLELALDEAEFSSDDGEVLAGVFVELIEE